ncbi:MAG: fluoride efflux transporter CrcB [Chloroflexi bacterium]|nr:MAG: fluoride efflux transporter CrcB [Chloroflexota bacterium]
MKSILLIGLGAMLGANARYWLGVWAARHLGVAFPYATFFVNVTGSLALGFLVSLASQRVPVTPEVRLLIGVGFLGSYTTFSSFAVESLVLAHNSGNWHALLNIFANNLVGLACAAAGMYLARTIA